MYNLHVEGTHTYTVRGAVVHNCFLLRIEDNMESIGRAINSALQLSKRGGESHCC
ncbi:intein C-terminal splicing region domain protein [Mycobacterium xenopi 3993]|nr:intein C-terminal splicing region domain protein [Mycobacterium xenopi 3993]